MNQADNLNNGTFIELGNFANSPQSEQASCPFYSVLPHNNTAIMKLPLLMPAEDKLCDTELPSAASLSSEAIADAPQQDWVAEPDSEKQALIDAEFKKLLALNEELRSANTNLYEQVEVLKGDLSESEKALQWQKKRSSVTESMLNQQNQELAAAQEQINSLFQQLETAVQTVQRQENLIETYKAQLEISQQRLAQLERECAKIQTNYNEQSHQVLQSENACRELRTRLMRQQRQTLQFKAALEKCLETPVPSYDFLDDSANSSNDIGSVPPRYSQPAQSSFANAEPIKPWSVQLESFTDDLNHPWGESLVSPSDRSDRLNSTQSFAWEFSANEHTPTQAHSPDSPESLLSDDHPITPEAAPGLSNIDEQLDDVIQMFFAAQPASVSPQPSVKKDADKNPPVTPIWEAFTTPLPDDEEPVTAQDASLGQDSLLCDQSPISSIPLTETTAEEPEDYWSEMSQLPSVDLPGNNFSQEPFADYTTDAKSPSPVIYPQRPPKGRKSWASVQLPNFRPKGQ